jgi:hypothetical protein
MRGAVWIFASTLATASRYGASAATNKIWPPSAVVARRLGRMGTRRLPPDSDCERGPTMNREQLRERAEAGKLAGMTLAADAKPDKVTAGKIAFLRALLKSPDSTATIDDATEDLTARFRDGGKWRGLICLSLAKAGLIRRVDVVLSRRPSRHRGYVTKWRLMDRNKAALMLLRLSALSSTYGTVQTMFPSFKEGAFNDNTEAA